MNLFGKKKTPAVQQHAPPPRMDASTKVMETIGQLDTQITLLLKRSSLMETRIKQNLADALRKKQAKDTKGALFELQRKKVSEGEITKIQGQIMKLEQSKSALESSHMDKETILALKNAAATTKIAMGGLDAEKLEEIMEEFEEAKSLQDEIRGIFTRDMDAMEDDEDLMKELEELDQLASMESTPAVSAPATVFSLPSVPMGPVAVQAPLVESEEDRELRELEASMTI